MRTRLKSHVAPHTHHPSVDKWQLLHPSKRLIGVQMRLQLGTDSYRPPCDNLTVPDAHGRPVRTTAFVSVPHIRCALLGVQCCRATHPPEAACSSPARGPQPGLTPSIRPSSLYLQMRRTRWPPSPLSFPSNLKFMRAGAPARRRRFWRE
jgi:hypothetical protein